MRSVQALLSLARRYGAERVDATCVTALAHDMLSMRRLRRMLETAVAFSAGENLTHPALAC